LVGAFAADGSCCTHNGYQITYYFGLDEVSYVNKFAEMLELYFHKKPYIHPVKNSRKIIIRYRSKEIYELLNKYLKWNNPKTYSIRLKRENYKEEFLIGFLRGYFDSDGYTEQKASRIEIMGVSKYMIFQIKKILIGKGFDPYIKTYQNKNRNKKMLYTLRLRKKRFN
jgi:intein/homing endonuclease